MGGASKCLMLLSTPFPLQSPHPSLLPRVGSHSSQPLSISLSVARFSASLRLPSVGSQALYGNPLRSAGKAHGESASVGDEAGESPGKWPEWRKMVERVTVGGYVGRQGPPASPEDDEDSFSICGEIPEEFTKAARACLLFARERPDLLRSLPRRDVEVLVENGSPFLFKNGVNSVRRMKQFIDGNGSNALGAGQALTVDVMRYLLSYAYDSHHRAGAGGEDRNPRELAEASARSLLLELAEINGDVQEAGQTTLRYEPSPDPRGERVEMKRGDWISPKCSFMNFSRNMYCLHCREDRPRRQLTGREWECPQCEFFNHGRNVSCLRCDHKRPEELSTLEGRLRDGRNGGSTASKDAMGEQESENVSESAISRRLDRILGRSSPTTEAATGSGSSSPGRRDSGYAPFVPLPADMFRKTPRRLKRFPPPARSIGSQMLGLGSPMDPQSPRPQHPSEGWPETGDGDGFPEIMPIRKGENRFVVSKKKDRSLTSPQYKRKVAMEQAGSPNFVPFVPFPPGYFARKDEKPSVEDSDGSSVADSNGGSEGAVPSGANSFAQQEDDSWSDDDGGGFSGGSPAEEAVEKSLEGSAVTEPDPLDMSEEAKAQRWFRRVAQITDISELSKIPDEDFPEIMPMRKGINRFVVSKRKTPLERRLTSPQYRRNLPVVSSEEDSTREYPSWEEKENNNYNDL
ncbi:unnamed protein product [Spirodela intermedia]|uniref:RanBP2-type domain-containing protein n=1 Tax=Spirodela intermedia TaxID=51605 RepID=A0A7I8IGJ2_SPIIN|nr:unnamed protein product [Spirodela intermedia]CAA6656988.1 unnamed protein product [Spirodela intermedia]